MTVSDSDLDVTVRDSGDSDNNDGDGDGDGILGAVTDNVVTLADFFRSVITVPEGWFVVASSSKHESDTDRSSWRETWFQWPADIPKIVEYVRKTAPTRNTYFSPYLFSTKSSKKQHVVEGSRTIAADLDEASVLTLPLKPTILVQTSPGRHQGYWILANAAGSLAEHERLSKRMTYAIPRCDLSGWPLGKKLRIPNTNNFKYEPAARVTIVDFVPERVYRTSDIDRLPKYIRDLPVSSAHGTVTGAGTGTGTGKDDDLSEEDEEARVTRETPWVKEALEIDIGPQELITSMRSLIPPTIVQRYNIPSGDRSSRLWSLMMSLFRAGVDRKRVMYLAYHSANNKFAENRYGGIRDLAKDVLRAEKAAASRATDVRQRIIESRRFPGSRTERNQFIAKIVREYLLEIGQFIACSDGTQFYILHDKGKPIAITSRSSDLFNMIDTIFGINATDHEARFIVADLCAYASDLPVSGVRATLSYYDSETRSLLFHTGQKDVILITAESIRSVVNGYGGVVFDWSSKDPISPETDTKRTGSWADSLFNGCFDNVVNMTPQQATSLLRVWFMTVLFRHGLVARPLLAALGQPGSGKSTLFRRIVTLMFGNERALSAVSTATDFDFAVSSNPIVVLDNVDTWERWLPDRLALSAATSEIVRRKLYTDTDTITLQRQAMIGITAHNPKFGREDVTDRLLILMFERLQHFQPESDIMTRIDAERNILWAQIIDDAQKILRAPKPDIRKTPQFRVEDFARFGHWIASAFGPEVEDDFCTAISSIRSDQRSFILDEDSMLVDALFRMCDRDAERTPGEKQYRTAGQLWSTLESLSGDPLAFQKAYTNAVSFGKKIWAMQDALREVFVCEWKYAGQVRSDSSRKLRGANKGSRVWSFQRKDQASAQAQAQDSAQ